RAEAGAGAAVRHQRKNRSDAARHSADHRSAGRPRPRGRRKREAGVGVREPLRRRRRRRNRRSPAVLAELLHRKGLDVYVVMALAFPLIVIALLVGHETVAQAYIGPGAGISVIGTAVAFVGSVIFTVIGFIWYPLKRLFLALKKVGPTPLDQEDAAQS